MRPPRGLLLFEAKTRLEAKYACVFKHRPLHALRDSAGHLDLYVEFNDDRGSWKCSQVRDDVFAYPCGVSPGRSRVDSHGAVEPMG